MLEYASIFDEIQAVLDEPASASMQEREQLEHTLTAGYAHALALEAERWRVERRIGEVAAMIERPEGKLRAEELAELAAQLSSADRKITRLRAMLSTLKTRVSAARAVA